MSERWYYPWCQLISRYLLAKEKRVVSPDEIKNWPMYRIWGLHEDAQAYFGLNKRYFRLEDVPEDQEFEGNYIEIREIGKLTQYVFYMGEWREVGSVHDEWYKE